MFRKKEIWIVFFYIMSLSSLSPALANDLFKLYISGSSFFRFYDKKYSANMLLSDRIKVPVGFFHSPNVYPAIGITLEKKNIRFELDAYTHPAHNIAGLRKDLFKYSNRNKNQFGFEANLLGKFYQYDKITIWGGVGLNSTLRKFGFVQTIKSCSCSAFLHMPNKLNAFLQAERRVTDRLSGFLRLGGYMDMRSSKTNSYPSIVVSQKKSGELYLKVGILFRVY